MFFLLFGLKWGKSYSILENMSGKLLYTEAFCTKKVKWLPKVRNLSIRVLIAADPNRTLSIFFDLGWETWQNHGFCVTIPISRPLKPALFVLNRIFCSFCMMPCAYVGRIDREW